jgi:hypothetical protein
MSFTPPASFPCVAASTFSWRASYRLKLRAKIKLISSSNISNCARNF